MMITGQQGVLPNGVVNPSVAPYIPQFPCDGPHWSDLVRGDLRADLPNGKLQTASVVLPAGIFQRRTVLGQRYVSSAVASAYSGNKGNGTVGNVWIGVNGIGWTVEFVSPTSFVVYDGGTFARITAGTVGTTCRYGQGGFTITAGGTAFAAGDSFGFATLVGVTASYAPCVQTATDGTQVPMAILADDVGCPTGGMSCRSYVSGAFNAAALIIDPSWVLADMVAALATTNIYCK